MRSSFFFYSAMLASGLVLALPPSYAAQEPGFSAIISAGLKAKALDLPEAPTAQIEVAAVEFLVQQSPTGQSQSSQQPGGNAAPGQNPAPQESSSVPTPAQTPAADETKYEKAEKEINEQEHQRVLGIIPAFNISYRPDAVSLTPGEKIRLAYHSAIDPYTFGIASIVAGLGEVKDDNPGFGWGFKGYAKRSGAAYLDAADGTMIGNAFLPILLHQDPRYFRLGHGTFRHRFLYAVATSFICKHDNTGKWEPNYSNVGGNIISGAISNYYYPSSNTGIGQTIDDGLTVTFEGTFGATLQEFWPDISRKFFHKDPTRGLDAQAAMADKAKNKAARTQ
jgi:hypothetical protein